MAKRSRVKTSTVSLPLREPVLATLTVRIISSSFVRVEEFNLRSLMVKEV